MKRICKRVCCVLVCLLLVCLSVASTVGAAQTQKVTVLFTHDLHSHFLPSADEDGGEYGGYARLMTVIKQQKQKYPDAVLVDGGDFSMGSLFQTAFATSALELRMMGAMGYDVTTFGNHEFDYLQGGLISMLNAAVASKEKLPSIVEANYRAPKQGEDGYDPAMQQALDNYGVKDHVILERGGVYYVMFGIFGFDSDECAPNSGMILEDPAQMAQKIVNQATAECKKKYGAQPVVICLSHSGTEDGKGEDYELAKAVDGIHVIVSGHTHTTLNEAIEVDGTYIVSAGEYGKNLGVVQLDYQTDGTAILTDYDLIPINQTVSEDPEIAVLTETYKKTVEQDYLSQYGVTFDQVLTDNPYHFDTVDEVYATQHESTLGNVFSDAYRWAAQTRWAWM